MWSPKIKITYTDGNVVEIDADKWETVRSDGIDNLIVYNPLSCSFQGNSLYWLYSEAFGKELYWVIGQGSINNVYSSPVIEIVFRENGEQIARDIKFMPDIKHSQIKLGWWK